MVCCCLISARIELERTQDMHNGTLARRSHIPSRSRRHNARALALQPSSRRRACARRLAPEAIRPPTERPRGDRTDVFVRGRGDAPRMARSTSSGEGRTGTRTHTQQRRGARQRRRSDGAHPLGHWFHGDAQSPSATALHRPWCQSRRRAIRREEQSTAGERARRRHRQKP